MADTLKLTPRETVTIRSVSPDLLEVEGRWGPGGKPPPAHYHPEQEEHFEVLDGTLTVMLDGEERDLGVGETLDIPRRTSHQVWNRSDVDTKAIWQTRPALRTEDWFRSIDRLFREGRVGKNGMPGPLAFGVYLTEYRDVFRLSSPPDVVARPLLAVLGLIGRARGYRT